MPEKPAAGRSFFFSLVESTLCGGKYELSLFRRRTA